MALRLKPATDKQGQDSLSRRVTSAFESLQTAATQLNSTSDHFSKLVSQVEAILKAMNLGVTCWIKMGPGWGSLDEHDIECEGYEEIGYCRIGKKWGIALREVVQYQNQPDDVETWAFHDGPRRLRLRAVEHIPDLLEELAKKATGETEKIADRMDDLRELVTALKEGAKS